MILTTQFIVFTIEENRKSSELNSDFSQVYNRNEGALFWCFLDYFSLTQNLDII